MVAALGDTLVEFKEHHELEVMGSLEWAKGELLDVK